MTIKLTNARKFAQAFNLTVELAPKRHIFARANDKGSVRVILPESITLLAGESREFVDGVLTCPEIQAALKAKPPMLIATEVAAPKEEPAQDAPAPSKNESGAASAVRTKKA